jgi:ribA/ribD-fused uncharacterized protein
MKNKQELLKRLTTMSVAKLKENPNGFDFEGFNVGVLSNWHSAEIVEDGIKFCCAEQMFMYKKAIFFGDEVRASLILNTIDPKRIKELSGQIYGFDKQAWMVNANDIMFHTVLNKFMQNNHMTQTLLNTKDKVLVYCNEADLDWGAGIHMQDPRLNQPFEWPGDNNLGFVMMKVRSVLQD